MSEADHVRYVQRRLRGALAQVEHGGVGQVDGFDGRNPPDMSGDTGPDAVGGGYAGDRCVQRQVKMGAVVIRMETRRLEASSVNAVVSSR